MSADLRSTVEALKADFDREPTNGANLAERAPVFWDWINAYALTGGPIPVGATGAAANAFRELVEAKRDGREARVSGTFDDLIAEFRFKDENPNGLGTLTLSPSGPFPAESWITIEQTYTVGDYPMKTGATVVAGRGRQWNRGDFQNDGPGDGYLTIKSSNPNVRFAKIKVPWAGMHGGGRAGSISNRPSFRLERGTLTKGETFTLVYGDRTGGGRGWQLQSYQNTLTQLPVYIDLDADGKYPTPSWPAFTVVGTTVNAVKGFAPSVVEPGEKFELAVRSEDLYFNRATGDIPAYEVTLNDKPFRTLSASGPALNILEGVSLDAEGVYRFGFRSPDGKITGSSNPIWVRRDPPYRIYWGETHTHTGMAEGQGSIDGSYRYGRDDARLDFLGLSEHDGHLDDFEWKNMREAVERYNDPGKFIAFLGYEWTVQRRFGGHHNVFYRKPFETRVGKHIAPNLSLLYQELRERFDTNDVVIIPHAHQSGDWRRSDPDMQTLIEIMSMHGTFEWFGNYYLRNGHQIGFVAASDDHRTRPGYSSNLGRGLTQFGGLAAALASEKTNDAIFDALKQRRAYAATTADRIIVDFELNGEGMGQRIPYSEDRRLRARVMGSAAISEVAVVKNGDAVYRKRPLQTNLSRRVTAEVAFESSSEPFIRDNPRGVRIWKGSIEVKGAKLVDFQVPHVENRHVESWKRDGDRIVFNTITRGRADSVLLQLEGATPSAEIVVELEETTEFGKAPVQIRGYATHPASVVRLPFSELRDGLLARDLPVAPDADQVTLQLISDDQPMDYDFEFVDTADAGHGDYYYVRVKQLNGAMAWSSPIWVGGEEPR